MSNPVIMHNTIRSWRTDMDTWKFESNPGIQTALALSCIVVGIIFVIGFRNFDSPGLTNTLAGSLLGLLLLGIGISAFIVRGRQTIVVDPVKRCIVVEDTSLFGTKNRLIPFSDIVHTGIGYLGKRSNFVNFYYIVLKLRSGEEYSLFAPGRFFKGSSDKSVMENRRQRIEEYLKQHAV